MSLFGFLSKSLSGYKDDDKDAKALIARELAPLTPNGFWDPQRAWALNFAFMGPNIWRYTLFPFGLARGYRKDLNGLVVHQTWKPVDARGDLGYKDSSGFTYLDVATAKKIVSAIQLGPTLEDVVRTELSAIENQFEIKIPLSISNALVKEAPKVAARRWSANKMRIKDRLIPLDGSAPRDLAVFE